MNDNYAKAYKEVVENLKYISNEYIKNTIRNEKTQSMLKFYTHEQEKEYGVVGIQIKLVKQQLIISRILFKIN